MKTCSTRLILALIALFPFSIYAQTTIFSDDFESYNVGELLAANSDVWTTWSGGIDAEDAPISNAQASSGSNSVHVVGYGGPVDLVLPFPEDYTSGAYEFSLKMYMVTGKGGYFNIQQSSTPGIGWMFEIYFDAVGGGYINAGGSNTATVSYIPDTWTDIKVKADLTNDHAELYVNSGFVYSWKWSLAATGGGTANQIGGVDIFAYSGDASGADYYVDDILLTEVAPASLVTGAQVIGACPGSEIEVPFSTASDFNPGNVFTAELSDENGSFTNPVSIGSLNGVSSGTIAATIPGGTPAGSGYRIRVVASDPATTGIDNGTNIAITDLPQVYYADTDGDGYGNPGTEILTCTLLPGYVTNGTDCDDLNNAINPGMYEDQYYGIPGVDDNCDGFIDCYAYYQWPDADGDGFGDANASSLYNCGGSGYSWNNYDCNDSDAGINPGAYDDYYDGVDDNCDGFIDCSAYYQYPDADGDGYGDDAGIVFACPIEGYTYYGSDCNDNDASINPGVFEVCSNGIDENCNGLIDDATFFYADADLDGWGDVNSTILDCSPPSGYVANAADCDDTNADVNPYAFDDDSNGIDNNCDGCVDGYYSYVWPDADGDGFGDASTTYFIGCTGNGYVWNNYDCDDNDAGINPSMDDYDSNGIDNNCDGCVDGYFSYLWPDADDDGYGDMNSAAIYTCDNYPGYSANYFDCDDGNATINPDAKELCNGVDDNCNGIIDEDCGDICTVPVGLNVSDITGTSAKFSWEEVPGALQYKFRYKVSGTGAWTKDITTLTNAEINNLTPNTTYTWQVKEYCQLSPPIYSEMSPKQKFTTGSLRAGGELTQKISLQLYPNPAEDQTTIHFTLSQSSRVTIKVYDVSGKEVEEVFNNYLEQGSHSVFLRTEHFSKGVYFVKLVCDFDNENQKLIVQ